MDMYSRKQYLREVQKDYLGADKLRKIKLLDEAQERTGLVRKYLIRRLSVKTRWEKNPGRHKRSCEFQSNLIVPLVRLWDIFDEPCGQRLRPLIRDELSRLRQLEEIYIDDCEAAQLNKMSPKTIDRLLSHEKATRIMEVKYQKGKQPLLYHQIPTKLSSEWDRNILGQIQIDAVEHCGQSTAGEYLNTVAHTDIGSQWWEAEAVMGKGKQRTLEAIQKCRERFPVKWIEIHPDNGTSFINYFLYDYANLTDLEFSRSRPYQKNDNCFIEQKNSRNVRRHIGYVRYDTATEQNIINDLYRNELRLYKNFFQPVMRLEVKERNKGHVYRKYQEAKTPYRWLIDNPETPPEVRKQLYQQYSTLNPAELKRKIEQKLKLLAMVYQAKHNIQINNDNRTILDLAKVTFSFDPTTEFRLPTYLT